MRPCCPERVSVVAAPAALRPIRKELAVPFPGEAIRPGEFDLPINALWATDPRAGSRIECVAGGLWITQAGDERDIVLRAGQTFVPAREGRVVVQALCDARVRLA